MSPSEKVRAMLDERGIEHDDNDANTEVTGVRITRWKNGGKRDVMYEEWRNGTTRLDAGNVSPEQAIAATVGMGTCRAVVCNQSDCVHNREYRCTCTDLEIQDQECLTYRCRYIDYDEDAIPYINGVAKAHAQSLKREYHRGYEDGKHSMDAEHRAVVMRLRQLPLDGGSVENVFNIARAVYHNDFGWAANNCAGLRDELVRLMGGVSDRTAEPMTTDEFIKYVEEDTRRLKGEATGAGDDSDTCCCAGGGACTDCDGGDSGEHEEVEHGGAAHDCAADSRGGSGSELVHMAGVSITDELRKWVEGQDNDIKEDQCWILEPYYERKLLAELAAIADRIDEQYDQLQAKLDEYDQTHVELPRDRNGKVFNIGCTVKPVKRDTKLAYTVSYMDLAKDGWRIGIRLDQYRLKYKPQTFEVCDAKPDPIEETIEKLTLGEITQTEAIERIKSCQETV